MKLDDVKNLKIGDAVRYIGKGKPGHGPFIKTGTVTHIGGYTEENTTIYDEKFVWITVNIGVNRCQVWPSNLISKM